MHAVLQAAAAATTTARGVRTHTTPHTTPHAQGHTHLLEEHGHPSRLPRVARMLQEGDSGGVGGGKQSRSLGLALALQQRLRAHHISGTDARKEVRQSFLAAAILIRVVVIVIHARRSRRGTRRGSRHGFLSGGGRGGGGWAGSPNRPQKTPT